MWRDKHQTRAFALYEVLLGLMIFVIGVVVLGRSVQNCLNASTLSAEDDRVRQILSNRMAELQAAPGFPDKRKEIKINTGYGEVTLVQTCGPAGLQDDKGLEMGNINKVVLEVEWRRNGVPQSRKIAFYVYRAS
jgi:Tfp pilus assembly protein PilV